jgi:hypothetical protein
VNLFPPLSPESRRILDGFSGLVDAVFPVPKQFRPSLARDVAELSRLLTSGRGDRNVSYLGQPKFLSAYLRYFLPWNLYRLCRLLPALPLSLGGGDVLLDLGSGPLTFAAALWISRPDLRTVSLEFRCVDQAGAALEAGQKLFAALSGGVSPWSIKTIRAPIETLSAGGRAAGKRPIGGKAAGNKSATRGPEPGAVRLTLAINLFNELYEDISRRDPAALRRFADKQARFLLSLSPEAGSLLIVEPGVPRSGEFIAALRASLLDRGRLPAAPCTHAASCPCPGGSAAASVQSGGAFVKPGGKGRWCHFAFETEDAAPALQKLSAAAGIPKERAVLSFLLVGPVLSGGVGSLAKAGDGASLALPVRIISDLFPVQAGRGKTGGGRGGRSGDKTVPLFGRYGCCEKGLVLIRGSRELMEQYEPGTLKELVFRGTGERDPKSGAPALDTDN